VARFCRSIQGIRVKLACKTVTIDSPRPHYEQQTWRQRRAGICAAEETPSAVIHTMSSKLRNASFLPHYNCYGCGSVGLRVLIVPLQFSSIFSSLDLATSVFIESSSFGTTVWACAYFASAAANTDGVVVYVCESAMFFENTYHTDDGSCEFKNTGVVIATAAAR
jgi:hypothetical protein